MSLAILQALHLPGPFDFYACLYGDLTTIPTPDTHFCFDRCSEFQAHLLSFLLSICSEVCS